ncbi:MAG TPA: YdbH domain-containing protein, partial [Brevundimonas sp.]
TRATVTASGAQLEISRSATGFGWNVTGPVATTMSRLQAGGLDLNGVQGRSSSVRAGGLNGRTEVSAPLTLASDRLQFGELDLKAVRSTADLQVVNDGALQVTATAAVASPHGAWPLFGPITAEDIPELAEMKLALGDFALSAPSLHLSVGAAGTEVRLTQPARVKPANGGVMTLTAVQTPVFVAASGQLGGGALSVTSTRGKGLPEATFSVPRWSLTPTGFTADLAGDAALDFGLARTLTVTTKGRLTSSTGRLTYAPSGCSSFTAGLLELGENDVSDVAGQLCPGTVPLVTVADDGWHIRGRFASVSASAPFLEAKVADAAGTVAVDGSKGGDLTLSAAVEQASASDAAAIRRFNPLGLSGTASLAKEQWTGTFDLASSDHPLGQIVLHNDGVRESGGLTIDTGMLTFAQGGLQPLDLSPLVAGFISPPVTGQARFTGKFDWSPDTEFSSGVITIPGLDFVSPIGDAKGLKGEIVLTSLVPLTTAANQTVTLDSLAAITPLTDLKLNFGLEASAVTISGADLRVGGGIVRIEPLAIPFDRSQSITGALVFENVQIGNIFSGAGLDDKVKLDAIVSGRVPFTSGPEGVRVVGGVLNAVQPGRLSLQREALTGLEASNNDDSLPPNAMTDLAYQALENLAFDDMTIVVNSLDAGLLNLRFGIHGRHDPPNKQEIRLTWLQVLRRQFFDTPLPLPSGTGVNLNLDTTLNANQLIGDLLELNRVRQGQSAPAPIDAAPISGSRP